VSKPIIIETLDQEIAAKVPVWLMRQAGRYLPEYRELRSRVPSFMEFCGNPKLCVEATLQPIRRFGFDAAIIFSDILVIPHALGQSVSFETGSGPRLKPLDPANDLSELAEEIELDKINATFESIEAVRSALDNKISLIGFCGAPWTVASYMIAGKGTPDQAPARLFAYCYPKIFQRLINLLVDSSVKYLAGQIDAGADVIQIFDSWAGVLPDSEFERWCFKPVIEIVSKIKERFPETRIIVFSKGGGVRLEKFASVTGIDCLGIDTSVHLPWAREKLQGNVCIQGNLDPIALLAGGYRLDESIESILDALGSGPFIFNLGHGILPGTPIAHVDRLVKLVRAHR
jgi:uroporphyrinogen decarboxylase